MAELKNQCEAEDSFLQTPRNQTPNNRRIFPSWYSQETGIYHSKHPSLTLPSDPFLDIFSLISSQRHNGFTALIDSSSGISIKYSDLFPLVKSMASGLHQMGVSQGDVVLIMLPNSIFFPIIFLSVLSIGAIVTCINPLSSLSEVKKQVLECRVKLGFCPPEKVSDLSNFGFPVFGVPKDAIFSGSSSFHKLLSSDPSLAPRPKISQKDTAAILYSSGTTGSCKATVLTHGNFIASIILFVRFDASQYEYLATESVHLAVVPMFHIYGICLFVMGLLSLGSTIVVMRKFEADGMVSAIERYGVTHFHLVPPLLMALTRKAREIPAASLRSLRQVSCGAAPVTSKCIEDFVNTFPGVDFVQGYGLTESTAVGTRGYVTNTCCKYSSVGLLAPTIQARVVDWNTGTFLPPGRTGELWLRGPGTMKGYLNNKECTMSTIDRDGWLHTGDIVHFDQDGYMYITDRLKEVIKYKGFQIAPADLESILTCHPHILDAAVTSASDEEAGEIPVAFIVRRSGSKISEAAVVDFVAKQVAPYKKVRKVYFITSVPRSPSGKILRRKLKDLLISKF